MLLNLYLSWEAAILSYLGKFYFMLLFVLNVLCFETTTVKEWYGPSSAWSIKWELRKNIIYQTALGTKNNHTKYIDLNGLLSFQHGLTFTMMNLTHTVHWHQILGNWAHDDKFRKMEHKLVSCTAHVNIVTVNVEI